MHLAAFTFTSPTRMDGGRRTLGAAAAAARRVLIIAGPTGVGKSSTALAVARAVGGEIVGADSVQVFRGLDVGSNKATVAERASVPHHLVDVADVGDGDYSAGMYLDAARAATDDVLRRSRVPVVVGGTMMYVRWYLRGRPATPPPTAAQRAAADALVDAAAGDWDAALATLAVRDAARARALNRNDWYRLRRALEVSEAVPGGVSALPQRGASPLCAEPHAAPYDLRCVFLYDDRVALNRRVDRRVEQMVAPAELLATPPIAACEALDSPTILAEAARLLLAVGESVTKSSPARSIGYRQTIAYLTRMALDDGCDEKAAFREYVASFQAATRNYCKQQFAWYRKDAQFRWVPAAAATEVCTQLLRLDADEYKLLESETADAQLTIRKGALDAGRRMKTYVPANELLVSGSCAEDTAISVATMLAHKLRVSLPTEALVHINSSVTR